MCVYVHVCVCMYVYVCVCEGTYSVYTHMEVEGDGGWSACVCSVANNRGNYMHTTVLVNNY